MTDPIEYDLDDLESDPRQILMDQWGYPDFRDWQKEILPEILNGDDVLCVAPTGGGKSLLYQLPAIMRDGCVLVTSPLIALMKDQVEECTLAGIPAGYVNSEIESADEQQERLDDFRSGAYKVFFVAPERMRAKTFRDALAAADVSMVVNDEAHCASQWGHDFRPAYARLFEIPNLIEKATGKRPQILALTATATPDIEDDIAGQCGMGEYTRYVADPIRPNLKFETMYTASPWAVAAKLVNDMDLRNGRYIFYTTSRKMSETIAQVFADEGVEADLIGFYHAGMTMDRRKEVQEQFKRGRVKIIVATSAFGMGINVPNIRMVGHFGIPDSLESYVQQAGRAGRDGAPSRCILVHSSKAVSIQEYFINVANPPYDMIQTVWDHLNHAVGDSESILRESADDFAKRAASGHRSGTDIAGGQVSTAFNILEAAGAIKRSYSKHSTEIVYVPHGLAQIAQDPKAHRSLRNVADAIPSCTVGEVARGSKVQGYVSKSGVAKTAGVSEGVVSTVFKKLADRGVLNVRHTYRGKDTQVVKHGAALEDLVSKKTISERRQRALARLSKMLSYAGLSSEHERKEFIRTHFLSATTIPSSDPDGPF